METETRAATDLSDAVAKEIRVLLVRLDLKQAELATRMGMSEMWVSRRLRGAQPIDLNDLQRFAGALDVEVVDLLPRPGDGHVVVAGGTSRRKITTPTARKPSVTDRTRPTGHPDRVLDRESIRRPARLRLGHDHNSRYSAT